MRLDGHHSIELPDVGGYELILESISELGYATRGMNGLEPITFADVSAWSNLTEPFLDNDTLAMLVRLSREYAYHSNISIDPKTPEPYTTTSIVVDMAKRRADVERKMRAM